MFQAKIKRIMCSETFVKEPLQAIEVGVKG